MEIIPSKEIVQVVVTLTLSHHIFYPCSFHLLIGENAEKHIYLIDVKIQHHQLYQHVVWHVVDRVVVVAPQAVFLLELLNEIRLYGYIFFHRFLLLLAAKIHIILKMAKEKQFFFLFFVRFFVPLTTSKILLLEKTQIKFGFLLAYSYLCPRLE